MRVQVGEYTFPAERTFVNTATREVLSRVRKDVEIISLLTHPHCGEALQAEVETLEREFEKLDRREAHLSLHEGRYYSGWRRDLQIKVRKENRVASVRAHVLTDDRFERSIEEHVQQVNILQDEVSFDVEQAGNGLAFPSFLITAVGTVVNPQISDGTRTILYEGSFGAGQTLYLDSESRTAVKNGSENVLAAVSGEFPRLSPGVTTLTYRDGPVSAHDAQLEVWYRDLWV